MHKLYCYSSLCWLLQFTLIPSNPECRFSVKLCKWRSNVCNTKGGSFFKVTWISLNYSFTQVRVTYKPQFTHWTNNGKKCTCACWSVGCWCSNREPCFKTSDSGSCSLELKTESESSLQPWGGGFPRHFGFITLPLSAWHRCIMKGMLFAAAVPRIQAAWPTISARKYQHHLSRR